MLYYLIFMLFLFVLLVVLLLMWMYWSELLCMNLFRESMDSYECGFDSKDMSRLPFSLRFFLMMMFFILLDMEMCLLMQLPYEYEGGFFLKRVWFYGFLFILLLGVVEELRRGFLKWKR